jgi:MFS family permease
MEDNKIKLGLRENWQQFSLLLLIIGFVGGMVGMERSLLPQLAEQEFHIASRTAMFSFILAFGITKAITNYFTGVLANKLGRRRLLILGWVVALPIPWILMYAPSWNWIVFANILLGLNQGLAWSTSVVMKIDLVGEKYRGLAVGLNEFGGYLAVGLVALLSANLAAAYGLRPYPFIIGIAFSVLGLFISWLFVKDTHHHVTAAAASAGEKKLLKSIFWGTTLYNRNLSSVTQAGLINNLNDSLAWGLFPLLLVSKGFNLAQVGVITGIYPAFWGLGQLFTGRLSDFIPKKVLIFWGMFLQALTLLLLSLATNYTHFIILSVVLGLGKAMVYPTFTIAIAENSHPLQRAESVGIFRFWRDSGYAIGAILTGILTDAFGIAVAIMIIGGLTLVSALVVLFRMQQAAPVNIINAQLLTSVSGLKEKSANR